ASSPAAVIDEEQQIAQNPGGVSLGRDKMQMNLRRESNGGIRIPFDQSLLAHLTSLDFDGLGFEIQAITSVADAQILLGLNGRR
ncbi:MAG: hypothetical protein HY591_04385, partial [Candidatus Omnitrophica bacterium]|nr:hypothetical protein [Candidatus Omnitrophota bacterium]